MHQSWGAPVRSKNVWRASLAATCSSSPGATGCEIQIRNALTAYRAAARKNLAQDKFGKAHVEVSSFDAVTDPGEIAFDLITLVS
jgi:hypothetical protein